MGFVIRNLLKLLFAVICLLLIALLLGMFYRSYSQFQLKSSTRLDMPNAVESLETIEVNTDTQWIYLRGQNRDNPVLLFLHGGPGMTELPIARSFGLELEKHFTVVHWDQRGSGKSRGRAMLPSDYTIQTYLNDVKALTNALRERFDKEKIYLVGHSWGSLLGALSARDNPQLYHAYVGVGQIAKMADNERLSLNYVRRRAQEEGNSAALEQLARIDSANYAQDFSQMQVQRQWLYFYGGGFRGISPLQLVWLYLSSPEYSLGDLFKLLRSSSELPRALWPEVMQIDLPVQAGSFEIPVFFLAGAFDYNTPSELARAYMETLSAPRKELIWFGESSHFLNVTASQRYQEVLIDRLLGAAR